MKYIQVSLLTMLLLAVSPVISAAESSVANMANIVLHLNHYPTAVEKESLANIIAAPQSSAGEKALAGALMRMQHRIGGEDAKALHALAADKQAPRPQREFAEILLGIVHQPSAGDIKRLQTLAN